MNITHESTMSADLYGPMTESEFIIELKITEKQNVAFANRASSHRASSPLSFNTEGWIVLQYNEETDMPILYDSVQHPSAYLSASSATGRVVGRHSGENYWVLKY